MKPKKIAVLGGTGKSGKYLVEELIRQGFQCRLLLRNPATFSNKNANIEIIRGDARTYTAVKELLDGCDAVVSTLGQPQGEPSIFSTATSHVIAAMREAGITRYIVTTGLNVDTPFDQKNESVKAATAWMYKNYPKTTADKQTEYDILLKSEFEWSLVRLPLIELTSERKSIKASLENCPGERIGAADLAHFLVGQLLDNTYIRQAPFIANV